MDDEGGLCLSSGVQRFYEGPVAFRFPMLFSGIANARESHDDHTKCFRIIVDVRNPIWAGLGITAALMSNGSRSSLVISQSTFSRRGRKDASNARGSHAPAPYRRFAALAHQTMRAPSAALISTNNNGA